MVGVKVREEDLLDVDETDRRAQELALCPLAAVEEQAVAAPAYEQRARAPARGRGARRGAEEDDVEIHRTIVTVARGAEAYGRTSVSPGVIVVPLRWFACSICQIAVTGIAAVVAGSDRPERVVGPHAVERLRPVRARGPGDDAPEDERERREDDAADESLGQKRVSEHVFVAYRTRVRSVKGSSAARLVGGSSAGCQDLIAPWQLPPLCAIQPRDGGGRLLRHRARRREPVEAALPALRGRARRRDGRC